MLPPVGGAASADDLAEGGPKGGLVFSVQVAELADDEALFEGGDDRLDGGGLEQSGALPVAQPDLAEGGRWAELGHFGGHFGDGVGNWWYEINVGWARRITRSFASPASSFSFSRTRSPGGAIAAKGHSSRTATAALSWSYWLMANLRLSVMAPWSCDALRQTFAKARRRQARGISARLKQTSPQWRRWFSGAGMISRPSSMKPSIRRPSTPWAWRSPLAGR
jgi:hypothetical protein